MSSEPQQVAKAADDTAICPTIKYLSGMSCLRLRLPVET